MWLAPGPGWIRPVLFNAVKFRKLPFIANHSARRALAGHRNLCRPSSGHDTRPRQATSPQVGETRPPVLMAPGSRNAAGQTDHGRLVTVLPNVWKVADRAQILGIRARRHDDRN